MLLIDDILVSDDLVEEHFRCHLEACRGACCWEGDWGAPLEAEELATLEAVYDDVEPFLSPLGRRALQQRGLYTYFEEAGQYGTTLLEDGACAYMTLGPDGIAQCGFERAWRAGATPFRKPVSCHLYPVRVVRDEQTGMEGLNYDRWHICSAACARGKKEALPVYRFAREALVRKYGPDFYEALDASARRPGGAAD